MNAQEIRDLYDLIQDFETLEIIAPNSAFQLRNATGIGHVGRARLFGPSIQGIMQTTGKYPYDNQIIPVAERGLFPANHVLNMYLVTLADELIVNPNALSPKEQDEIDKNAILKRAYELTLEERVAARDAIRELAKVGERIRAIEPKNMSKMGPALLTVSEKPLVNVTVDIAKYLIERNVHLGASVAKKDQELERLHALDFCRKENLKPIAGREHALLRQTAGIASLNNWPDVIEFLITQKLVGIDVLEKVDETMDSPLIFAARRGHVAVVETLLRHGVRADIMGQNAVTALMTSSMGGHTAVVKVLLQYGADPNMREPSILTTALLIAADRGHADIVKMLLQRGASVDIKNSKQVTALELAAVSGHAAVVEVLLEHGANPNTETPEGMTVLMLAAKHGHTDIAEVLLKHGTDVNRKTSDKNYTAIMFAAYGGHTETVEMLMQKGANIDVINKDGKTALQYAKDKGHKAIVDLLASHAPQVKAPELLFLNNPSPPPGAAPAAEPSSDSVSPANVAPPPPPEVSASPSVKRAPPPPPRPPGR